MPADTLLDLWMDDSGDIAISANGDLKVVPDSDVVAQEVQFRLRTVRGDWQLKPDCGADLELLIGQANSPQTGARMEAQIARALTHDGFLGGELKTVRAVPINRDQLMATIKPLSTLRRANRCRGGRGELVRSVAVAILKLTLSIVGQSSQACPSTGT